MTDGRSVRTNATMVRMQMDDVAAAEEVGHLLIGLGHQRISASAHQLH